MTPLFSITALIGYIGCQPLKVEYINETLPVFPLQMLTPPRHYTKQASQAINDSPPVQNSFRRGILGIPREATAPVSLVI